MLEVVVMIRKIKKLKNAPGWLGLTDDRTEFVYLSDRAEIVQNIFRLSIAGLGGYTIAKLLNGKKVPAFGSSKRWDQSTIHNMLSSRATIGEYQRKQVLNGKEFPLGEPIPNYYPAVIDRNTFEKAQIVRRENLSTRRGRKGKSITNLFSDIPRCFYCGSTVKLRNSPSKSLICKKVWDGDACFRFGWTYESFEHAFLLFFQEHCVTSQFQLVPEQLETTDRQDDEGQIYQARMAIAQRIRSEVVKLTIAFGGRAPQLQDKDRSIRRDHPDRYFTVTFSDGDTHEVRPAALIKSEPVWKLSSQGICDELGLSPRQGKLTALLAEGQTLSSIASELGMTLSTARWHLREIFRRTNSHSQAELISLAKAASLPQPGDLLD
jgi:DNA-binding CsgD family transcriptional regulator